MTTDQYKTFLSLSSPSERESYLSQIIAIKHGLKSLGMFEIPNIWVTPVNVDEIHTKVDFANISEMKLQKSIYEYEQYHQFKKPITLDRNFYSLDGLYVLLVAKACGVKYVPAIILENVEIRQK